MNKNNVLRFGLVVSFVSGFLGCGTPADSIVESDLALSKCQLERTVEPEKLKAAIEEATKKSKEDEKKWREKLKEKCNEADQKKVEAMAACLVKACRATGKHIGDQAGYGVEFGAKAQELKCNEKIDGISDQCKSLAAPQ